MKRGMVVLVVLALLIGLSYLPLTLFAAGPGRDRGIRTLTEPHMNQIRREEAGQPEEQAGTARSKQVRSLSLNGVGTVVWQVSVWRDAIWSAIARPFPGYFLAGLLCLAVILWRVRRWWHASGLAGAKGKGERRLAGTSLPDGGDDFGGFLQKTYQLRIGERVVSTKTMTSRKGEDERLLRLRVRRELMRNVSLKHRILMSCFRLKADVHDVLSLHVEEPISAGAPPVR